MECSCLFNRWKKCNWPWRIQKSLWNLVFNGVFLKDEKNLLEQAIQTTKALHQMRFESMDDIDKNAVLSYAKEAIENQKLGKEIKPERKGNKVNVPAELKTTLIGNSVLTDAFKLLSPANQRDMQSTSIPLREKKQNSRD